MNTKNIFIIILIILITSVAFLIFKKTNPSTDSGPSYSLHLLSDVTNIQPNEQKIIKYDILDNKGTIVKDFAMDHEKLMHLIVVRRDLQDFQHLHPDFNKNIGEFTVPVTFPHDGSYRLYADFVPVKKTTSDQSPSAPYYDFQVGNLTKYKLEEKAVLPDNSLVKHVGDYTITYSFPNPLPVGVPVKITAHVTKNGQPVTDMQEYLGAQSHGIILDPASPFFAHIHAMGIEQDNTMNDGMDMGSMAMTNKGPDITFQYTFPLTGVYKLFTQFQHQDKVITDDLTILAIPKKEVSQIDNTALPVQHIIEFENDQIRVVRYIFQPHAKIPMHHAPDVVAIYLTDANLQLVFPDGRVQNEIRKPGESVYLPSGDHSGENLADTVLEFVAVQLKDKPAINN